MLKMVETLARIRIVIAEEATTLMVPGKVKPTVLMTDPAAV